MRKYDNPKIRLFNYFENLIRLKPAKKNVDHLNDEQDPVGEVFQGLKDLDSESSGTTSKDASLTKFLDKQARGVGAESVEDNSEKTS